MTELETLFVSRPGDGSTRAAEAIAQALSRRRFTFTSEDRLQQGIAAALAEDGFPVEREVRLSPRDRIDLLVRRTGIEVKIAAETEQVQKQVARYLESDRLDAIVLVTTRLGHVRIPPRIAGKPVVIVSLVGAGL